MNRNLNNPRAWLWAVAGMLAAVAVAGENPPQRLERDGVVVELSVMPVAGSVVQEGTLADIRLRLSTAADGQPLAGQRPGAWLDHADRLEDEGGAAACRVRIGRYLKGGISGRPLLDLNGYSLLILNQDASLTVIDPTISVAGTTSTLARIPLKRAPMDWAASSEQPRLYVSMPTAGEVAVIDTDEFRVLASIAAGPEPVRVALQPDQHYLWVGNNGRRPEQSGVTVIDTRTLAPVKTVATGAGHHDIAFSDDSRHAFVSNREAGTLTVFDVASLSPLRDIRIGPQPLAVAFSPLSQAVYVSDGQAGSITVIDARDLRIRKVIEVGRGIGPLRFSPDGRHGLVLNTAEDEAVVIDAATDEVLHRIAVAAEPYQLAFTRGYAYVRGLSSPRVTMIRLSSLGPGRQPVLHSFEAGPAAPKLAGALPLAEGLAAARDDAAVFVVNPVNNTTYFYAEGMNAPMFSYLNRGHTARAARVVDRSLRELSPGVYGTRIRLPAAGRVELAVLLNQPEITHCFATEVVADPALVRQSRLPRVEFLPAGPLVAGVPASLRLRLSRGRQQDPLGGVGDLRLRYFRAPASRPGEVAAVEVAEGLYEVRLTPEAAGAYYLHAGAASLGLAFGDQPYASVRVLPAATGSARGD